MRLGLVVPGFGLSDSDWCIPALSHYVRKLSGSHAVRVFALRYPHHSVPYRAHGAAIFPLGGGATRGTSRLGLVRRAAAAIDRAHRTQPFDVLHAFWADEPGYVATRAARRLGVPSIVSVAGGELVAMPEIGYGGLTSRWNRWFLARSFRDGDVIGVGSTTTAVQVEGRYRAVSFLPFGVDLGWFAPRPSAARILEGRPALLHVASLTPVKDQKTLFRAMAIVLGSAPQAVLHVVGDGPLRPRLERLRDDLRMTTRLRFHGFIDHRTLPDYYRAADLLVMSSLHEAQGMAVLEAAAAGLPAVGTRVGALADLGEAALTVPLRDSGSLGGAIAALAGDAERRRAMGAAARRRVAESYALDDTVARFEAVYRELDRTRARYNRRISLKRSRSATTSTV